MYPRAPVALVAVEIRFPGEMGAPMPSSVQQALREVLGKDWINELVPLSTTFSVNLAARAP